MELNLFIIFLFLLTIINVYAFTDITFDEWKNKYYIKFSNVAERKQREKNFHAKKTEIRAHNLNLKHTYKKSLNKFAHLSSGEFIATRCKLILPEELIKLTLMSNSENRDKFTEMFKVGAAIKPFNYPFGKYSINNAPNSVNYTYLMEPVQDQGECASCWAFATLGQIEGMLKVQDPNYNTILGPQYLIDCDFEEAGCDGGWPTNAMKWLKSPTGGNNTAPSMTNYLYTGVRNKCLSGVPKLSLKINTITQNYFAGDEASLKVHVANFGPTVVAVFATDNLVSYSSGVLYDYTCPSGTGNCSIVNHAMIVTGYGTDSAYGDYWLMKNSWSSDWGEDGYIRMARNKNNLCNIACWSMNSL